QGAQEQVMRNLICRFIKDDQGATAIEYGLIAAGIAVAIITVVGGVGTNLNTTFTSVQGALRYPHCPRAKGSGQRPEPFCIHQAASWQNSPRSTTRAWL